MSKSKGPLRAKRKWKVWVLMWGGSPVLLKKVILNANPHLLTVLTGDKQFSPFTLPATLTLDTPPKRRSTR